MASKLIGATAAFVVMFVLSFLWHEILMGDYYAAILSTVARAEPNMVLIVSGYLVTALIMGFVYPIGYQGGSPVAEGLRFGAIIGALWWLPANLVLAGVYEQTLANALVDGGWHVVEGAVGGVAIALLHARSSRAAEAVPAGGAAAA